MVYSFNGTFSVDKLTNEVRESSITIALDFINYAPPSLDLHFKANLSSEEESALNDLIATHDPVVEEQEVPLQVEVLQPKDTSGRPIVTGSPFSDTGGFRFRGASFKDTVLANTTKSIDYQVTQERWINGGQLILSQIGSEDRASFQVVDKDYLYAGILYPADFNGIAWSTAQPDGVVLDEFIKDYYIPTDMKLEIALAYPARILAGLYIRLIYTSTSGSDCLIKCNLYLHWKAS